MHTHVLLVAVVTAAVLAGATACGGNASANGGSAAVSSGSGTTTVTGNAAGHSFSMEIGSLSRITDELPRLSGSAGSDRLATSIGRVRTALGHVRAQLAATAFPSLVRSQKGRLLGFLDRWGGDLGRAQASARNGDTAAAIRQARSSTYSDLRGLLAAVSAASVG
jgi:hypothetical protein